MVHWKGTIIPHFTLDEAKCRCCGLVILQPGLLAALEVLRQEFDAPIIINSWTRCKKHNRAVGGKKGSYHLNGMAVDITPKNGDDLDSFEALASLYFPFVLRYATFIHCDIRGERP